MLAATSRDDDTDLMTINLAKLNGASADRIEILTDPAAALAFTRADFDLFV